MQEDELVEMLLLLQLTAVHVDYLSLRPSAVHLQTADTSQSLETDNIYIQLSA